MANVMQGSSNRDAFRRHLVDGQDESVEVNQRALIDKILARYSGEFTVFRELLQNSDDAQSSAVEIRFQTAAYHDGPQRTSPLHDLRSILVTQWTFKNNGITFREEDWSRLRKIAEGNPDEKKIGAFGVGFYSLFSVTENPFVSSGGYGMEFYWKDNKNQLNVRHGNYEVADSWTTFEMVLRETSPMPHTSDLMRFIASSITFMVHLNRVDVYFDEHRIGRVQKSPGVARAINVPVTLKPYSQLDIMHVKGVKSQPVRIEATIMLAVNAAMTEKTALLEVSETRKPKGDFFSSPVSGPAGQSVPRFDTPAPPSGPPNAPITLHKMDVTLNIFTAEVDVKVDQRLSREFYRSTKKNPPAQLKYHLVYTGKGDYDQSLMDDKSNPGACIFRGLRADLNGATNTRIFIGHATGQTTGVGGHMASYFIPTVERESIDFVDRNIAIWNEDLLYVGGFLARVAFESGLSAIHDAWASGTDGTPDFRPPRDLQHRLHDEFLHTLKFFTFHRSTPLPKVAQLLEASFYGCSTAPLRMLSSVGVQKASDIKEYDPVFAKFLKSMPMLPQSVARQCERIVQTLRNQGLLSRVTISDVLHHLRQHQLNKEELVSCLRWWIGLKQDGSTINVVQLLDAITVSNVDGSILPMSSIKHFINPQTLGPYIPRESPLPTSLLSQDIAKQFTPAELSGLGWQEFTIVDWLEYISRKDVMAADPAHDLTRTSDWAARIITVLSQIWLIASDATRRSAKELFTRHTCVPTSHGLLTAADSYLPGTSTGLFRDLNLPMVQFSNEFKLTGEIETFLAFIGVRKHVDPQLILNCMAITGNWNITGLIGYLLGIRKSLTPEEVSKLRSSPIFSRESSAKDNTRYCACELYAPTEIFRQFKLPVILWDETLEWSDDLGEAKLLFHLGLRDHPPLEKILGLCSSEDAEVRTAAFWYFCDNLALKYFDYDPCEFGDIAFIPAENNNGRHLEKLDDVFLDVQWKALGFSVIQDDYRGAPVSDLGIQQHPPTPVLLTRLEKIPPSDENAARKWFELLLGRISTFERPELVRLTKLPIVPTSRSGDRKWLTPVQCYIDRGTQDSFHSKLFDFVDFGPDANRFLNACGSRNEPTVADVAESLVNDPKRFQMLAGHENFLTQLRNLAVNRNRIPNTTLCRMKLASILLGKKVITHKDGDLYVYDLRSPKDVVIADDINAYHLFRSDVFIAPQEELLEGFYEYLGCKRLSDLVQEQCEVGEEISNLEECSKTRALVLERLDLFLHEYTHTKPKVTVTWLSDPGNFKVKKCRKVSVSKTLTIGNTKTIRSQDTSVGAKKVGKGQIELWLSHVAKLDMYEVSTSLCRFLFGTVRVSESLLFTTILSTDLEALGRRGCNVDSILRRRQLEQEQPKNKCNIVEQEVSMPSTSSLEPHDLTHTLESCVVDRETSIASTGLKLQQPPDPQMDQHAPSSRCISPLDRSEAMQCTPTISSAPLARSSKKSYLKWIPNPFKRSPSPGVVETTATPAQISSREEKSILTLSHVRNQQHIIPLDDIENKVNIAIKACSPEDSQVVHHPSNVEAPTEALNDYYCHDVSEKTDNLKFLDDLPVVSPRAENQRTIKVFVTQGVPDPDRFMVSKYASLSRFVSIIVPIAEVHGLSTIFVNIFYDVGGGSIAFNRNGSLFLNLRYFEAWHDRDVEKGDKQRAQISWFFTLAHEIAHNLVKSHNSEHAFWFSAICEARMSALGQILGPMARH